MVCETCSASEAALLRLTNELSKKERELSEVSAKFKKSKLQFKAKVAQLRQQLAELTDYSSADNENESAQSKLSRLVLKIDETESALTQCREENEQLRTDLSAKTVQLSDHQIRIRTLEEQLELTRSSQASAMLALENGTGSLDSTRPQVSEKVSEAEQDAVQKVYAQLVYKDTKILDLNNLVLEKDRQILDLQELCREKEEVAGAKTRAIQIMHEQLLEKTRETRDAATEISESLHIPSQPVSIDAQVSPQRRDLDALALSPGRAVPVVVPRGGGSPPPLDPAFEDQSSITTESATDFIEGRNRDLDRDEERKSMRILSTQFSGMISQADTIRLRLADRELDGLTSSGADSADRKRRSKKKVTFDFSEQEREQEVRLLRDQVNDLEVSCSELRDENEELRATISEQETSIDASRQSEKEWELQYKLVKAQSEQLQSELEEAKKEGKNNVLKAKAQVQSRVKELEMQLGSLQLQVTENTVTNDEVTVLKAQVLQLETDLERGNVRNAELTATSEAAETTLNNFKAFHEQQRAQLELSFSADVQSLKETVEASQDFIRNLESENGQLQLRLDIAEADFKKAQRAYQDLVHQRQSILSNVDPLKETVEASKDVIYVLETENDELKHTIEDLQAELEVVRGDMKKAQDAADMLLQQKNAVLEDIDELKEAIEMSQEVIEALEKDLQLSQAEAEVLREHLGEVKNEKVEITSELIRESTAKKLKGKAYATKLRILEKENEELSRESTGYRLKWKAFEAKIRVLQNEKDDLEQRLKEAKHYCEAVEQKLSVARVEADASKADSEEGLLNLRSQIDSLTAELKDAKEINQSLSEDKMDIEIELHDLWKKESELKRSLAESVSDCGRLRQQRMDLFKQIEEYAQTETKLTHQIAQLTTNNKELKLDAQRLTDKAVVLESGASEETKNLAAELQKLKEHFESIEESNISLKQQVAHLATVKSDLSQDKHSLQKQLSELKQAQYSKEKEYSYHLEVQESEIEKWRTACGDQEAAIIQLQEKVQFLELKTKNQEAESQDFRTTIEQLDQAVFDKTELLKAKHAELTKQSADILDLNQKLSSAAELQSRCDQIQIQLDDSEIEKHRLTDEITSLQLELAEKNSVDWECSVANEKLSKVRERNNKLEAELSGAKEILQSMMQEHVEERALSDQLLVESQSEANELHIQLQMLQNTVIDPKVQAALQAQKETSEMKITIDQLVKEQSSFLQEISCMKDVIHEKEEKNVALQESVNILDEKATQERQYTTAEFYSKVATLTEMVSEREGQIKEFELKTRADEAVNRSTEIELHKTVERLNECESELSMANRSLQSMIQEEIGERALQDQLLVESQSDTLELQAKLELLQNTVATSKQQAALVAEKALQRAQQEACDLQLKIDQLLESESSHCKEIIEKQDEVKHLEESLVVLQLKIQEKQQENDNLVANISDLSHFLAERKLEVNELEAKNSTSETEKSRLQIQLLAIDEKFKCCESELAVSTKHLEEERKQHEFILAEMQHMLDELRSTNEELESTVVLKSSKLTQMNIQLAELEQKVAEYNLVSVQYGIDDSGEGLELQKPQLEVMDELRQRLQTSEAENQKLVEDRHNLCKEILDLNSQLNEAQNKIEANSVIIEGLNQSIDQLIKANEQLEQNTSVSRPSKSEPSISELENHWSGKVTSLEEENQLLRHCLNAAEQSRQEDSDRIEELDILCTAQKGVVHKLREQIYQLENLIRTELSNIMQDTSAVSFDLQTHSAEMDDAFGEVRSIVHQVLMNIAASKHKHEQENLTLRSELEDKASQLESEKQQKSDLQLKFEELSSYYFQIQSAYGALYHQYQEQLASSPKCLLADAETSTEEHHINDQQKEILKLKARIKKLQVSTKELKEEKEREKQELELQLQQEIQKGKISSNFPCLQEQVIRIRHEEKAIASELGMVQSVVNSELQSLSHEVLSICQLFKVENENLQKLLREEKAAAVRFCEELDLGKKLCLQFGDRKGKLADQLSAQQTLEDILLAVQSQYEDLQLENTGLTDQVGRLSQELAASFEDKITLEQSLSVAQDKCRRLETDLNSIAEEKSLLDKKIQSLQGQVAPLEAENQASEERASQMTDQLQNVLPQEELDLLQASLAEVRESKADYEARIADLQQEAFTTSEEVERYNADLHALQQQLDESNNAFSKLKEENLMLEKRCASLTTAQGVLEDAIGPLENRIMELEEDYESILSAKNALETLTNTQKLEIAELAEQNQAQNQASEQRASQMTDQLQNVLPQEQVDLLQASLAEVRESKADCEARIADLQQEAFATSEEVERYNADIHALQQQLDESNNAFSKLKEENLMLEKRCASLTTAQGVLEDAIGPLENRIMELEEDYESILSAKNALETLTNTQKLEIAELAEQNQAQNQDSEQRASQMTDQLQNVLPQEQVDLLQVSLAEVRESKADCEARIADLQQEAFATSEEVERYNADIHALQQQLDESNNALSKLKEENLMLEKKCVSLTTAQGVLEDAIGPLENRIMELEEDYESILSAKNSLETLTNTQKLEIAELAEQNQAQGEPLQELLSIKDDLSEKLSALEATCEQIHAERQDLIVKVTEVEGLLTNCEVEKQTLLARSESSQQEFFERVEALKTELDGAEENVAKLKGEKSQLESALEDLRDRWGKCDNERMSLQSENTMLQSRLEEAIQEDTDWHGNFHTVEATLESVEHNLEHSLVENEGLKSECNGLKVSLQELERLKMQLENDVSSLIGLFHIITGIETKGLTTSDLLGQASQLQIQWAEKNDHLDELEQKLKAAESVKESLKLDVDTREAEIKNLSEKLKATVNSCARLEENIADLKLVTQDVELLRPTLEDMVNEDLSEQPPQKVIEMAGSTLLSLKALVAEKELSLCEIQNNVAVFQGQWAAAVQQRDEYLKEQISKLESTNFQLSQSQAALKLAESEHDSVTAELKTAKNSLELVKHELIEIKNEWEQLKTQLHNVTTSHPQEIQFLEQQKNEFQLQTESAVSQHQIEQEKPTVLEDSLFVQKMKLDVASYCQAISHQREEIFGYQNQILLLEEQQTSLGCQVTRLKEEKQALKDQLQNYLSGSSQLKLEIEASQIELDMLKQLFLEERNQLNQQLEDVKKEATVLGLQAQDKVQKSVAQEKQRSAYLQQQLVNLQKAIETHDLEKSLLESRINDALSEAESAQLQLSDKCSAVSQLDDLQEQYSELQHKLVQKDEVNSALEEQLFCEEQKRLSVEKDSSEMQAALDTKQIETDTLHLKLSEAETNIGWLRAEIIAMEQKEEDLLQQLSETVDMKSKLSDAQMQSLQTQNALEELMKVNEDLKPGQFAHSEQKTLSLEQGLIQMQSVLETKTLEADELMSKLNEEKSTVQLLRDENTVNKLKEEELAQKSSETDSLKNQLCDLQLKHQNLLSELDDVHQKYSHCDEKLKEQYVANHALQQDLAQEEERRMCLKQEFDSLQDLLKNKTVEVNQLSSNCEEAENALHLLRKEFAVLQLKQEELALQTLEAGNITSKLSDMEVEHQRLLHELGEVQQKHSYCEEKLNEKAAEHQALKEHLYLKEERRFSLEKELRQLQSTVDSQALESVELRAKSDEANEMIQFLKAELDMRQLKEENLLQKSAEQNAAKLSDMEAEHQRLLSELDRMEQNYSECEEKLKEQIAEHHILKDKFVQEEQQKFSLEQDFIQLQAFANAKALEAEDLVSKSSGAEQTVQLLMAEIASKQAKEEELLQKCSATETLKADFLDVQTKCQSLQSDLAAQKKRFALLKLKFKQSEQEKLSLQETVRKLAEEKDVAEQQLTETQEAVIQLQHKAKDQQAAIQRHAQEETKLKEAVAQDKTAHFKDELQRVTTARDDALRHLGEMREQVAQYSRKMETFELKLAEKDVMGEQLRETEQRLEVLMEEKQALIRSRQDVQDTLSELKATLESSEHERSELRERLLGLNDQLTMVTTRESVRTAELQNQMEELQKKLQEVEMRQREQPINWTIHDSDVEIGSQVFQEDTVPLLEAEGAEPSSVVITCQEMCQEVMSNGAGERLRHRCTASVQRLRHMFRTTGGRFVGIGSRQLVLWIRWLAVAYLLALHALLLYCWGW